MITDYLNRQILALASYLAFGLLIRIVGFAPVVILLLTILSSIVYIRQLHSTSKAFRFPFRK